MWRFFRIYRVYKGLQVKSHNRLQARHDVRMMRSETYSGDWPDPKHAYPHIGRAHRHQWVETSRRRRPRPKCERRHASCMQDHGSSEAWGAGIQRGGKGAPRVPCTRWRSIKPRHMQLLPSCRIPLRSCMIGRMLMNNQIVIKDVLEYSVGMSLAICLGT